MTDQTLFLLIGSSLLTVTTGILVWPFAQPRVIRKNLIPILLIGLILPLGPYEMYRLLGAWPLFAAVEAARTPLPSLDTLILRLEKRLTQAPEDAEAWYWLGKLWVSHQEPERGFQALTRAVTLRPDRDEWVVAYAEVWFGQHTKPLPPRWRARLLALENTHPDDLTLLHCLALEAYYRHNNREAIRRWERVVAALPPTSESARLIYTLMAHARQRLA